MAIPRLILLPCLLALAPAQARASGGFDQSPPPTLPYYLDRLPAKPPALIFQETFNGPTAPAKEVDFKAGLLSLAADCEQGKPAPALLTGAGELLGQARLHPWQAAALCNLLNDVRDLFAAPAPITGKKAGDYIRWRVEHAGWFRVSWEVNRPRDDRQDQGDASAAQAATGALADATREDPLRVHWLLLRAALDDPRGEPERFQAVVDQYPDHPRAEVARFMLARRALTASRSHTTLYKEPTAAERGAAAQDRARARAMFEDYLRRYPQGRFAADVPGWLGALAFDEKDYLGALEQYIRQADIAGHPEVLKSAGFMCERCLAELGAPDHHAALQRVAEHPRLAMSLIYLLVNTAESPREKAGVDEPAQLTRWRRTMLPLLATAVAEHKDAYGSAEWQPRYLAILAQAASGEGDQPKALALCDLNQGAPSDDLAFIRLVALGRAHRLPEAIAAGREFAKDFPGSALAPGASLRLALALQDHHEAGAAVWELTRLKRLLAAVSDRITNAGEDGIGDSIASDLVYPSADANLSASRSVRQSDVSGAEGGLVAQLMDALLNFAPLPEIAAATGLDGAGEINLRAVLVQRWLAEEENFAEAKKYATPAQWSLAAEPLEKLAAAAEGAPAGEAKAAALSRLAEGWASARGRLLFSPLETDATRQNLFGGEAEDAGIRRRENGLSLGIPAEQINHALAARDEWQHASAAWLKAADFAPAGSALRARALWSALRAMPSSALASPFAFLRAGETDQTATARELYDRLRRECPASREAREFAVYYDLRPPLANDEPGAINPLNLPLPDLSAARDGEILPSGEPEYRFNKNEDQKEEAGHQKEVREITAAALKWAAAGPAKIAEEVGGWRDGLATLRLNRGEMFLVNYLDDLADFLHEPTTKLNPVAVATYLTLRNEMLSVEHWGGYFEEGELPPVPGATGETLNATVLGHIRAAYDIPEMGPLKDYLDFLVLAVVANAQYEVEAPGEMQDAKDTDEPGKKEPVTYTSRDYPKLATLAEVFLKDHPRSRKREAARLLYARALYAASRPRLGQRFAVWPETGHFGSGTVVVTRRQQPFDPARIGAALNASDREFPQGRYAGEIRNLRGLLAWRTQDWELAIDFTLQTLADDRDAVLQRDAARRLESVFVDGLSDETERARCLAAIKSRPDAAQKLREFLPRSPYPFRTLQSWLLANL